MNYFDFIPIELSVSLIVLLEDDRDVLSFEKSILVNGIIDKIAFKNMWKSMMKDGYYDPEESSVLDHPLVKQIYTEFKTIYDLHVKFFNQVYVLLMPTMIKQYQEFRLILSHDKKYIVVCDSILKSDIYIKIDAKTLDLYKSKSLNTTKTILGNIRDKPYHCLNLINYDGTITANLSRHMRDRLVAIHKIARYGHYKLTGNDDFDMLSEDILSKYFLGLKLIIDNYDFNDFKKNYGEYFWS